MRPEPQREADALQRLTAVNVSFQYPEADEFALQDVDFEIGKGEIVALVGLNGSGKTTLAKLLCGLYAPTTGTIAWNGTDIRDYSASSVARRTAVVFQDFMRYQFTLRENVALGDITRFDDRRAVADAVEAAGALPADGRMTLETRLGRQFEGGTDLSLGQWQRLALARAYFRDSDLVVLDEPTAALDARSEYDLFERIRRLASGRAVVLISHRFSSVRNADRIYVLRDGRVVERGTHRELMAADDLYCELFTLQARAYLAGDEVEF